MNQQSVQSQTQRCLPAEYYTERAWLARDHQLLIDSWQLVGHVAQLPNPGDVITATVSEQDILLARGQDQQIRAFFNVCPHRGHRLVAEEGNKRVLTCPYHAWSFGLDGSLRGMKKTKTTTAPDRSDICLNQIALDQLAGFLFVNLSGTATPLVEFALGLEDQILTKVPEITDLVMEEGPALGHTYNCNANWKVLLDNYLECHHCGAAHESFDDMMCIAESKFELYPNYTFQHAPTAMKEESTAFPLNLEHDVTLGQFWWLFPNTVFGQFPGARGFYASRFDPVTPDRTERRSLSLTVAKPTDLDMERRAKLRSDWSNNVVSQEDRALCENVQRGMKSMGFAQGWYVTDPEQHGISEHAMRHFHTTYLSALDG